MTTLGSREERSTATTTTKTRRLRLQRLRLQRLRLRRLPLHYELLRTTATTEGDAITLADYTPTSLVAFAPAFTVRGTARRSTRSTRSYTRFVPNYNPSSARYRFHLYPFSFSPFQSPANTLKKYPFSHTYIYLNHQQSKFISTNLFCQSDLILLLILL